MLTDISMKCSSIAGRVARYYVISTPRGEIFFLKQRTSITTRHKSYCALNTLPLFFDGTNN